MSISNNTVDAAVVYIRQNWANSDEANIFSGHVLARMGSAGLMPASFVTSIVDTLIGIGSGIGNILTAGTLPKLDKFTIKQIAQSRNIIALPFLDALHVLNPKTSFGSDAHIDANGNGFITNYLYLGFVKLQKACSENWFLKHVVTRLVCGLLLPIACAVTRVVDLVIGLTAAIGSFVTFGKFASLNHAAYRGLHIGGLIFDLYFAMRIAVNPNVV